MSEPPCQQLETRHQIITLMLYHLHLILKDSRVPKNDHSELVLIP